MSTGKGSKHDRKEGNLAKLSGVERHIPIEEEKGYSVSFVSYTGEPYTEAEIDGFLESREEYEKNNPGKIYVFEVDPNRLRTMHAGISEKFSNGTEISDTVQQIKNKPGYINQIPIIHVVAAYLPVRPWERSDPSEVTNGRMLALFTEDHRRVVAARIAGVKMKAQFKSDPSVIGNYTTQDIGMSLEVRKYPVDKGAHQSKNKTTFPPSGRWYSGGGLADD